MWKEQKNEREQKGWKLGKFKERDERNSKENFFSRPSTSSTRRVAEQTFLGNPLILIYEIYKNHIRKFPLIFFSRFFHFWRGLISPRSLWEFLKLEKSAV